MARPSEFADFTALSWIERGATPDQIILRDQSAGLLVGVDATLFLRRIDPTVFALTSNTALTSATHNHGIITNTGASSINTHTLWTPTVNDYIWFAYVAEYLLRADPNGTDTIGLGLPGKYLELQTRGAVLLRCLAVNTWDIFSDSSIWQFQS